MSISSRDGLFGSVASHNNLQGSMVMGNPTKGAVKSVNGVKPDDNGNVVIPDGVDIAGAEIGQLLRITSVDENGKPLSWDAVDPPRLNELVKFRELEKGKVVYHAKITCRWKPGSNGVVEIVYDNNDIREAVVAECADLYEVTVVVTDENGTVTTYAGRIGDTFLGLCIDVNYLREITLSYPGRLKDSIENSTIEITVKTASNTETVKSPHLHYVTKNNITSSIGWESKLSDEVKALVPSVGAVQDGLNVFGQTYTTYVENISDGPIEVALGPRTFYYFGNTPVITVNRNDVSGPGSYCCFMFACGETPTELRDSVNTIDGATLSYGWPEWNIAFDVIKPNSVYKCVIQHGIPYLEEYRKVNTNAVTDLLGFIKARILSNNADKYWNPTSLSNVDDVYAKYNYLSGMVCVDDNEVNEAYAELSDACNNVVERVEPPKFTLTLSAHVAIGGEQYYTTSKTTKYTASAGTHLIKLTTAQYPGTDLDEIYPMDMIYVHVKNKSSTVDLTPTNDTYAITFNEFPVGEKVFYLKHTSDSSYCAFGSTLISNRYAYRDGSYYTTGGYTRRSGNVNVTYNMLSNDGPIVLEN